MSIRVTSDPETDRLLSLRISSRVPLPPEIALADPRWSADYFRMATFYDAYGLSGHPMVRLLEKERIDTMMSKALARSQHLDRVSHYAAWLGEQPVKVEDLTHPKEEDKGRAGQPRRGWFPRRRSREPPPHPNRVARWTRERTSRTGASLSEATVRATIKAERTAIVGGSPDGRRPTFQSATQWPLTAPCKFMIMRSRVPQQNILATVTCQ